MWCNSPVRGYEPASYGDGIADVYDDWYDQLEVDAPVAALAALAGDGPVLELGIGTGRLALPLAGRGVRVSGVDASPAMVARLRAKPGGDQLDVVVGDMAGARAARSVHAWRSPPSTRSSTSPRAGAQEACFRLGGGAARRPAAAS